MIKHLLIAHRAVNRNDRLRFGTIRGTHFSSPITSLPNTHQYRPMLKY